MNEAPDRAPRVDVVILSLNRPRLTERAVRSVLEQRDVDAEVWLVDQGSEAGTLDRLRALEAAEPRLHLIELGENRGVPAGRNIGMARGDSPWVVSIDNDASFADPCCLRRAVERMEGDPALAVLSFRIVHQGTDELDESSWVHARSSEYHDQEFYAGTFIGCGHAFRRDAIEEVGGYDDDLFFALEERELSLRLVGRGYRLLHFPDVTVRHATAPEERVRWSQGRYYFLVRNSLYIEFKHWGVGRGFLFRLGGYTVRGILNGIAGQALTGLRDGIRMCLRSRAAVRGRRMTPVGRRYIALHEEPYRPSFGRRVLNQLTWRKED